MNRKYLPVMAKLTKPFVNETHIAGYSSFRHMEFTYREIMDTGPAEEIFTNLRRGLHDFSDAVASARLSEEFWEG